MRLARSSDTKTLWRTTIALIQRLIGGPIGSMVVNHTNQRLRLFGEHSSVQIFFPVLEGILVYNDRYYLVSTSYNRLDFNVK